MSPYCLETNSTQGAKKALIAWRAGKVPGTHAHKSRSWARAEQGIGRDQGWVGDGWKAGQGPGPGLGLENKASRREAMECHRPGWRGRQAVGEAEAKVFHEKLMRKLLKKRFFP